MEELQAKINELETQINDYKKKVDDLYNSATLPQQFIDALIKTGFLKVDLLLNYTSAANQEFRTLFVKHFDKTTALTGYDYRYYINFTAATSDTCTANGHSLEDDYQVYLISTGTLPAPLSSAIPYYIINSSTNTFKLSTSLGGSAVNITDIGSGTHYLMVQ
jgi:hypothetical protein